LSANANDNPYDYGRLDFVRSLVPRGRGTALDVGCASGETTAILADLGYSPMGVDTDPAAVDAARSKCPEWRFELGTAALGAKFGPFKVVMALEVIEHIEREHQDEFVAELRSCLEPGGLLVLSTPGRWSLYSIYERLRWRARRKPGYDWWDPTHVGIVSVRELLALIRRHGFIVARTAGFHFLPERIRKPFGLTGLLGRAGFSVVVVARLSS
jgi:SAM-dependent methyltransferase